MSTLLALLVAGALANPTALDPPPAPSPLLPVLGGALLAAGVGLEFVVWRGLERDADLCLDTLGTCNVASRAAPLAEAGGGVLATMWAWKEGARDQAIDHADGVTDSRRGRAVGGLFLAGTGLAVRMGSAGYLIYKTVTCATDTPPAGTSDDGRTRVNACFGNNARTLLIANVASLPLLVGGAVLAGNGFGYNSAAKRAGAPVTARFTVSPNGVGVVGEF